MGKSDNEVKIRFSAETKEFKKGIEDANNNLRNLRSELKLNATQMKGNANDITLLKSRQSLLSSELQKSKEKVELTNASLQKAKEIYGEDSKIVQDYERKLLDAKNQEEAIKNEIDKVNGAIQNQTKANEEANSTYMLLSQKINDEESALATLKNEYVNVTLEQGKDSDGAKELADKISKLSQELGENKNKLSEAESSAEKLADSFDDAGNSANAASGGGFTVFKGMLADLAANAISSCVQGLKDFGGSILETGMNFESEMSKVGSVSGATEDDIAKLKETAKEMGASTKFTATESAEAMEYMGMAGWDAQQMIDGLPGILNLAAASGEDLGKTSDIVTDGLTAFGMGAGDAAHFADVMAAASASANTNVSLLGESFSYAAPLAGSLKYNVEDTSIALGLMANAGIKGSRGGTALKNTLTNLTKPTDAMQAAMDQLGISMTNSDGSTKSLMEVMTNLRETLGNGNISTENYEKSLEQLDDQLAAGIITEKKYNKSVEELNEATFGSADALKAKNAATLAGKEGMAGLLAIVNTSDEDFEKLTDSIYSATDAETGYSEASQMAEANMDNLKGDVTLMESAFEGFKLHVAEDADGPLRDLAQKVTSDVIPGMTSMYDKLKEGATWLSEHKTAVEGILVVVGSLTAGIAAYNIVTGIKSAMEAANTTSLLGLAGAQLGLNTAMLTCPLTWIVAGIALVVGGVILLYNKCEWFRDGVNAVFGGIKESLSAFFNKAKELKEGFSDNLSKMKETASEKLDGIKQIYEENGGGIKGILAVNMKVQQGIFQAGYNGINKLTGGKLDELRSKTQEKLNNMKSVYESHGGGIKGILAVNMNAQKGIYEKGYNAINKLTGGKLDTLKSTITQRLDKQKEKFQSTVDKVKKIFDFKLEWPKLKAPSISVTWKTTGNLAKAAQLLKLPGIPSFDVKWHAKGAIFTKPTIFGYENGVYHGAGEAGMEAALPLDRLSDFIWQDMERFIGYIPTINYDKMGEVFLNAIKNEKIVIELDKRELGRAVPERNPI